MAQVKEYQVGDYTFLLDEADAKRRKATPVKPKTKAAPAPQNKQAPAPQNKQEDDKRGPKGQFVKKDK